MYLRDCVEEAFRISDRPFNGTLIGENHPKYQLRVLSCVSKRFRYYNNCDKKAIIKIGDDNISLDFYFGMVLSLRDRVQDSAKMLSENDRLKLAKLFNYIDDKHYIDNMKELYVERPSALLKGRRVTICPSCKSIVASAVDKNKIFPCTHCKYKISDSIEGHPLHCKYKIEY